MTTKLKVWAEREDEIARKCFCMLDSLRDSLEKKIQVTFAVSSEGGLTLLGQLAEGTIIGVGATIMSPLVGTWLAYKQKRFETNMNTLIKELGREQEEINQRLKLVEDKVSEYIHEVAFPLIIDYSADEKEKEKIKFLVRGFKTIVNNKIIEQDVHISYYDTLKELTLTDIKLIQKINEYREHSKVDDTISSDPIKIENEFLAIKRNSLNKLERVGLVKPTNEIYDYDKRDEIRYLQYVEFTKYGEYFQKFFRME